MVKLLLTAFPSPNTPASVIEYFRKFNEPLPERFCASEDGAPQASDEPTQEPPQEYANAPDWSRYAQRHPEPAAQELSSRHSARCAASHRTDYGSAYAPSRGTECGSGYAASHRTDYGSAFA